jgi:hypothetical protein
MKITIVSSTKCILGLFLFLVSPIRAQQITGIPSSLLHENSDAKSTALVESKHALPIWFDANDHKGVVRAIQDLQCDIERVTTCKPVLLSGSQAPAKAIIVGTLGQSELIDKLVKAKKLATTDLQGKWESFVLTTVEHPLPGVEKALVVVGSDKRGTIYGIYELSRQMGVSPWYWWADVPTALKSALYFKDGYYASGEPKVKYRGIFINDEIPCMSGWAKEKFGGMNSKMYTHVFELLLRLRANTLWPGMWGSMKEYEPTKPILKDENGNWEGISFNEDDLENPKLADEYGIIMGTSHHEPMQRSQQEWLRNKKNYGNGEWNYVTNKAGIQQFFKEGIEHTKNFESLITMGMRGDDDKPMVDQGSADANFKVMEGIMKDQRKIIADVTQKKDSKMQQIWTLYSEVLDYFDKGMKVPDDMIIVLCDDNWGNVRRLPELNGKKHPGGYGMYYHASYYGAPRSSKWLNITQIPQMWEQLQLTYDYGVDKLWILNVGDIKMIEYPTDFFMEMAWNPNAFNQKNLNEYAQRFCAQFVAENQSKEAARILNTYCKYNSRITPELLDDKTYNLGSGEFYQVRNEYLALEASALRQFMEIPAPNKDAYQELILFPVQAVANLYDLYYSVAMNRKLAAEKDPTANEWAEHAEACFKRDSLLCADYNHRIAGGKWNHMMDQVHIGFTSWNTPRYNIMPKVSRVKLEESKSGGYVFSAKNGVVVMEAEHYFQSKSSEKALWTILPDMGRTLSGMALMPYTQSVSGASLTYKINRISKTAALKVHFIFDCTMPFIPGGHSITAAFEGAAEKTVNINDKLVWKNNYSIMYPTAAQRVMESELTLDLPQGTDGNYLLKYRPLQPGIVLCKIVVDNGGYEKTHLQMQESPYIRE